MRCKVIFIIRICSICSSLRSSLPTRRRVRASRRYISSNNWCANTEWLRTSMHFLIWRTVRTKCSWRWRECGRRRIPCAETATHWAVGCARWPTACLSSACCKVWRRMRRVRSCCTVSYTHLRAHETRHDIVCRLLLEKKKKKKPKTTPISHKQSNKRNKHQHQKN